MVVDEKVVGLFLTKLFKRIGPEDVAHKTVCGWLTETIDLFSSAFAYPQAESTHALQVVQSMELWAQTTVYAQELLVHDSSQW